MSTGRMQNTLKDKYGKRQAKEIPIREYESLFDANQTVTDDYWVITQYIASASTQSLSSAEERRDSY